MEFLKRIIKKSPFLEKFANDACPYDEKQKSLKINSILLNHIHFSCLPHLLFEKWVSKSDTNEEITNYCFFKNKNRYYFKSFVFGSLEMDLEPNAVRKISNSLQNDNFFAKNKLIYENIRSLNFESDFDKLKKIIPSFNQFVALQKLDIRGFQNEKAISLLIENLRSKLRFMDLSKTPITHQTFQTLLLNHQVLQYLRYLDI